MTVQQLKKELEKYPDNMDVFIAPRVTEFKYGLLNSTRKENVRFYEEGEDVDDPEKLEAFQYCVILDEE